jgi:hypothetical protein
VVGDHTGIRRVVFLLSARITLKPRDFEKGTSFKVFKGGDILYF